MTKGAEKLALANPAPTTRLAGYVSSSKRREEAMMRRLMIASAALVLAVTLLGAAIGALIASAI